LSAFQEIRSYEIFKACSDDFVSALAQHAIRVSVPKGTTILKEGALNDRLRILASGTVEVRVNNERVAMLALPGDLMGEISALAGRQVTASICAYTDDVAFYEIMASNLDQNIKSSPSDFGYRLYSVLAQQLSDKIIATNEKARQFEIGNRALIEINKNLDQKVQERTDSTFKKLVELITSLMPLKELLGDLASRGGPVGEAFAHVTNATDMLKAISDQFSTERLVRSRRVHVAEPDRKQQTIARMALGGTGAKLESTSSAEECLAALEVAPADLIFVSSQLASSVHDIIKKSPAAKLVYMVGSELTDEIEKLKNLGPVLRNIMSRHSDDRVFTVRNMATTVTKLISKDLFGLEKYMMWGVEAHTRPITGSADRESLITEMQAHLATLGVRSTITDRAAAVAEELLMNAIYDAPVDKGVHHYAHLPRTTDVVLQASEQGQFRFAADGMLAAVSVSDPFGAFTMETLLNYLERNATSKGEDLQVEGKGGAGRGLQQILSNTDLVVFNVRAGKTTEVIAYFNLDPNKKEAPRSFHFFSEI
jgi:CRP-like cAMP-binding protein